MSESKKPKLSEIKAREQAATEGPWKYCNEDNKEGGCQCGMIGTDENHILTSHDKWGDGPKMIYGENGPKVMRANARFSAHARQDIPHLMKLVKRLGKVLEDWGGHDNLCTLEGENDGTKCNCGWDKARALLEELEL